MASKGRNSDIGKRYATAFLDLAAEQGGVDKVAGDVFALGKMLAESADFRQMTQSSVFSRGEQGKAVLAIASKAGFSDVTRRFLGVLADNRRLGDLAAILDAVGDELALRKGEVTAEITSAHPLTSAQVGALEAALKKGVKGSVKLDLKHNADLLGGLVVRVGSKMIDHSVRSRLNRLHRALKGNTNGNTKSLMKEVA